MLVDLARNDLSRNGHDVQVEKYREVNFIFTTRKARLARVRYGF
jgi:hypothetical protein